MSLVSLGTAVAAFTGTVKVRDAVDFRPNGTTSGAYLQINGATRLAPLTPVALVATGGLTGVYDTLDYVAPFSSSGVLLGVTFECGENFAKSLTGDVSFRKGSKTASGSPLTNLNNVTLGSGTIFGSWLAQPLAWNPADRLSFSTRETPTGTLSTARYDCKMAPIVVDAYGS